MRLDTPMGSGGAHRFRQPHSGSPPKLTGKDEKEIKKIITENDPKKYGINAMSYTTAELHEYFLRFHGKGF